MIFFRKLTAQDMVVKKIRRATYVNPKIAFGLTVILLLAVFYATFTASQNDLVASRIQPIITDNMEYIDAK